MKCHYLLLMLACCCLTSVKCNLRRPLNGTLQSNRLKSGPVFLIDSSTILVTQFSYDNGKVKNLIKKHNKWFKGTLRDDGDKTTFVDLQFGNGTDSQLIANLYLGLNLYLHVPAESKFNVRQFSSIAIVNDKHAIKTSVPISIEDLEDLPEKDTTFLSNNGKIIFPYPKCCPLDNYYDGDTCVRDTHSIANEAPRIPIHEVKMKNSIVIYNRTPMPRERIIYLPYYYPMACPEDLQVMLLLDDNATLLSNLELLIPGVERPQLDCMDVSRDENNLFREAIHVCLRDMTDVRDPDLKTKSSAVITGPIVVLLIVIAFLQSLR